MADESPFDDRGRVEVSGWPGWRYLPFDGEGESRTVTVERDSDGCRLSFAVPSIVQRGQELSEIAAIVIAAKERSDRSEGLGA
jgi:hypothetical protein